MDKEYQDATDNDPPPTPFDGEHFILLLIYILKNTIGTYSIS